MARALEVSRGALPRCRPNPPVGCVVVRGASIVAEGFTQAPGCHHAEAMALATLPGDLSGCAAFVTLEPCSFAGRTPSCARALIARRIGAVFVAVIDSDPRNLGRGIALLRAAGIPVEVGTLAGDVESFIGRYLIR
ncbi:bifunctional diaminohydroxyphosphoribosylaminopyrimidine deaminase/5-amino-6-(5-phosphoribosylamino)uracil reductase RibD [Sorangium sp. So ce1014]|uniref:bifunctional diaminohydroxyphosphoribosylaminopyrimidine deaminase/5-amino-6-(5-phosphoribosylamino)uracil reductase RibD n=1 Tax=Sorangium sp. So ce1014 TaxID=3133326 RepID=UPI003F600E4F